MKLLFLQNTRRIRSERRKEEMRVNIDTRCSIRRLAQSDRRYDIGLNVWT